MLSDIGVGGRVAQYVPLYDASTRVFLALSGARTASRVNMVEAHVKCEDMQRFAVAVQGGPHFRHVHALQPCEGMTEYTLCFFIPSR